MEMSRETGHRGPCHPCPRVLLYTRGGSPAQQTSAKSAGPCLLEVSDKEGVARTCPSTAIGGTVEPLFVPGLWFSVSSRRLPRPVCTQPSYWTVTPLGMFPPPIGLHGNRKTPGPRPFTRVPSLRRFLSRVSQAAGPSYLTSLMW